MNVDAALSYLDFVAERHQIWVRRMQRQPAPWTTDPVLASRKFTNMFRILDPGSQYVFKLMAGHPSDVLTAADVLGRAFLYRMTNLPNVWDATRNEWGRYPRATDMDETLADWWCDYRDKGMQVFNGAYIIMPEPGVPGVDKTRSVVMLAHKLFHPGSPDNIVTSFVQTRSMRERFNILRAQRGIGDFIAMQVLTDWGYSPFGADQDESSFVVPGPGCRKGAKEIFPEQRPEITIDWAWGHFNRWADTPGKPQLQLPNGQLRTLSKMDIQNTLCEFSKYARYQRNPGKPRPYAPAHPGKQTPPAFPLHW